MKKFINCMQKLLIIFVLVAYIFPILFFPIISLPHILNTEQTVTAKNSKEKSPKSLLNATVKEPLNKENIAEFADSTFNEELKKFNVPGAVVAVVKDNNVIFEKGYGYSDIDKKIPVDPKTTVFKAASVSKLFTATAVMQLEEKGKVNLKENVNKYLKDFKIQNRYSKPITLETLLTHTAGFDERIIGEAELKTHVQEKSLKDNLIYHPRPIIREPGESPQYSNYGMSVAGHVVENVSCISFDKYIKDNIFKPLDMNNSSFSFDKETIDKLSPGYDYKNGVYKKVPISGPIFSPAGGLTTTADDMTKFMIAHLNHGTYNGTTLLNKDTTENMHKKHFPLDINIPGVCYGFSENYINGVRVISHRGDELGFHSILYLIPESNLGIFISTNGENGVQICGSIANSFISRYYPKSEPKTDIDIKVEFAKSNLKRLEGYYQSSRYPRTEIGKLMLLMFPPINVQSKEDTLIVKYPGGQDLYKEIEPLLFKNIEKGDTLAFKSDNQGNISYILTEGSSVAYEKIHWYENPSLHKIIFILFLALFLVTSIAMIIINLRKKAAEESLFYKYSRWIITSINILNLVFLLGMAKECISLASSLMFLPQLPNTVIHLLFIPIITTIFTFGLMILTFVYWSREKFDSSILLCNILICCVFLIFNLYLNYWNLLGFKFYQSL